MIHATEVHGNNKAREYLESWQRSLADFDNFRKRMMRDQEQQRQRVKRDVLGSLLSLNDNFQAIASHIPPDLAGHGWAEGVLHVVRQLEEILKEYGLKPIKGKGEKFDPNIHDAVSRDKIDGVMSGQVIEVVRIGYKLGDEVIRPAKVKVAE